MRFIKPLSFILLAILIGCEQKKDSLIPALNHTNCSESHILKSEEVYREITGFRDFGTYCKRAKLGMFSEEYLRLRALAMKCSLYNDIHPDCKKENAKEAMAVLEETWKKEGL